MPDLKIKQQQRGADSLERVHKFRAKARDCVYGAPANLPRRRRYERNTAQWLKYYLPEAFPLPWAEVHRRYIADLDYIAEHGGWKAEALPRGSGKTTIAEGVALKYILTGKSRFLLLLAAKGNMAKQLVSDFKTWLLCNDRIAADYPEVVAPIAHSKGIPQAMASLTANGDPVTMRWTANQIVFPDCPLIMPGTGNRVPAASSGAVIECEGVTAALRGMKHTCSSGQTIRPDMAIIDDPQTPESARSPEQCRVRLQIIRSDVAGLSGPGRDIRIVIPCTIIEHGDMADEVTDPEKSPDFMGDRQPFFMSMPVNMELWHEYNAVREEGLGNRDQGAAARKFYRDNKAALTEGAEVTWPARRGDHAECGIQWGMDQYFRLGEKAFATEMQNSPRPTETLIHLTKDQVLSCKTDIPRLTVPPGTVGVSAFIDCNPRTSGLHWAITAFQEQLSAQIVAYGCYPERGTLVPAGASEAQENALLFEGLRKVAESLGALRMISGDSDPAKIDILGIDGGYNFNTVVRFVRAARMPFQLAVSRGRASTMYQDTGRDVIKAQQHIHLRKNSKGEKYLSHNADALRETVHRAFMAGPDAPGGCGVHKPPPSHDEFAESITSMRLTDKAQGMRGIMYRWSHVPGGQDHLLDCAVGCYAMAHWQGWEIAGFRSARGTKKRRGISMRKQYV